MKDPLDLAANKTISKELRYGEKIPFVNILFYLLNKFWPSYFYTSAAYKLIDNLGKRSFASSKPFETFIFAGLQ